MDLKNASESAFDDFAFAIKEQLQFTISNHGDPQMIAALVERDKAIFGELETYPDNGLTGIQEKLYKINTGSQNWLPILQDEIETAKQQFVTNNKWVYAVASPRIRT